MNNTEREILFNFRKEIWNCGKWPVNSHHLNNITYDNYKFIVRSTLVDGLTNFEILKLILESYDSDYILDLELDKSTLKDLL
jgi:hypothetical protein